MFKHDKNEGAGDVVALVDQQVAALRCVKGRNADSSSFVQKLHKKQNKTNKNTPSYK